TTHFEADKQFHRASAKCVESITSAPVVIAKTCMFEASNSSIRLSFVSARYSSSLSPEPFPLSGLGRQLCRGRQMVNSLMMLAVEANGVVALRMMKLMRGGRKARREAKLMVSEKIHAAFEATASLMTGASGGEIVHRY